MRKFELRQTEEARKIIQYLNRNWNCDFATLLYKIV